MSKATTYDDWERDGDCYRLRSPLAWEIGNKGSGWLLVIPAGFVFESSVPRIASWIVSPHYRPWLLAAAVHDRLLEEGFDKAFAAGEWLRAVRAMAAKDRKAWLALPAYYGVVLWTVR